VVIINKAMKKLLLTIILFSITVNSFCQTEKFIKGKQKMHLTKSRVYKTIGYTFLGTGIAYVARASYLSSESERNNPGGFNFAGIGEMIVGSAFLILSVSPIIVGFNQKHKYKKLLSFSANRNEINTFQQNKFSNNLQPTISIKINF
jgi:hypothetical protein